MPTFAHSFEDARNTLVNLFAGWVFGKVQNEVVRPDATKPYFHGMMCITTRRRLWFQQSHRGQDDIFFGPLCISGNDDIPCVGTFIMGRPKEYKGKTQLNQWYCGPSVKVLNMFARVCKDGTSKNEYQLMQELCLPDDVRVWAVCRIVLFGNVACCADVRATSKMCLHMSASDFVYTVSQKLRDPSIWDAFLLLAPEALPTDISSKRRTYIDNSYNLVPPQSEDKFEMRSGSAVGFNYMDAYDPCAPSYNANSCSSYNPEKPYVSYVAPKSPPYIPSPYPAASPYISPNSPPYIPSPYPAASPYIVPNSPPYTPSPYPPALSLSVDEKVKQASKLLELIAESMRSNTV